jgi:hypothetical protein
VLSSAEKATRADLNAELHSNFKGTGYNMAVDEICNTMLILGR